MSDEIKTNDIVEETVETDVPETETEETVETTEIDNAEEQTDLADGAEETVEESADDNVKKFELFGSDSRSLYELDAEMQARVYTAPSLVL